MKFSSLKVNLSTIIEEDSKAPFSMATTPKCRCGRYSFSWIAPLNLDTYFISLVVKQGG